jgi:signal transduction histidine kinase
VSKVRAVVADLAARGLKVHLEADEPEAAGIPAQVATALSNAVREALSNVAAHAGTAEAWVQIRQRDLAVDGEVPGGLDVIVRDRGAGFDMAHVDRTRLGLRRSIAERVADCGGQASIWSEPGRGTMVRLSWPASRRPGQPGPGGVPAERFQPRESLLW